MFSILVVVLLILPLLLPNVPASFARPLGPPCHRLPAGCLTARQNVVTPVPVPVEERRGEAGTNATGYESGHITQQSRVSDRPVRLE